MSITDPCSVLILGAGVSAPFGMPLGGPLIELIAKQIDSERRLIFKHEWVERDRQALVYASQGYGKLRHAPIHGAFVRKWTNPENHQQVQWPNLQLEIDKLVKLQDLLARQTSETIDDFIVENPSYAEAAKIGIAATLLRDTYWPEGDDMPAWRTQVFEARHFGPKNERNWVHLLINIIRHGIRKGAVTEENKIKIISFNYDRILEYVLECQFSNTEANHGSYTKFVDVLHVHGCFEPIAQNNVSFVDAVIKCAAGIHVVNERADSVPGHIAKARKEARSLIEDAKEIYSVGFSFAGPNCQMIGLDQWGKTPRVEIGRKGAQMRTRKHFSFCNYDGNVGVKRSAEGLCQLEAKDLRIEEAHGTIDRPVSVADWLKSGHLGELPG